MSKYNKEYNIDCFGDLHNLLTKYRADKRWLFRGHANVEWEIIPKVGRIPYSYVNEGAVLNHGKERLSNTSIMPQILIGNG